LKIIQNENDKKGIEILARKLEGIFTNLGVEEIAVKRGDNFDPYVCTCISSSEDGKNTIKEVYQKGYKFAGRVIRTATVTV
jgi:molecular chaperone GrpE